MDDIRETFLKGLEKLDEVSLEDFKEIELTQTEKLGADIALLRELGHHILALFRYLNFDKEGNEIQPANENATMIYTLWLSALAIAENWEAVFEAEGYFSVCREDVIKEYVENKIKELWEVE